MDGQMLAALQHVKPIGISAMVIAGAAALGMSTEDLVAIGVGDPPGGNLPQPAIDNAEAFWSKHQEAAKQLRTNFPKRCIECQGIWSRDLVFQKCGECLLPRCPDCAALP